MTDEPIDRNEHRGMVAQEEAGAHRLVAEVEGSERALRSRREALCLELLRVLQEYQPVLVEAEGKRKLAHFVGQMARISLHEHRKFLRRKCKTCWLTHSSWTPVRRHWNTE
jgi:hypothetical protein